MIVKKSKADCISCPLLESVSVLLDTNSKDDLSAVDIVFFADFPTQDDLDNEKPCSSKFFRQCLDKYILSHPQGFKYLIVTSALCNEFDNDKSKLTNQIIIECHKNAFHFIKECNPSLVMTLGKIPAQLLKVKDYDKQVGKVLKSGEHIVIVNTAPAEVNTKETGIVFKDCFITAVSHLIGKKDKVSTKLEKPMIISTDGEIQTLKVNESYAFRIPSKFYTDNYRLVDIQALDMQGQQILYVFRDKDNKKECYMPPARGDNYYWYEGTTNDLTTHVSNTELKISNVTNRIKEGHMYESDLSVIRKQAVDYYYRSSGEAPTTSLNALYFDIEVYTGSYRGFPDPSEAKFPINAISFTLDDGKRYMFLLVIEGKIDARWKDMKKDERFENVAYFDEEKKLMLAFFKVIHQFNPDYTCGWNTGGFDNPYIFNRCKRLKINVNKISPHNYAMVDSKRMICRIAGLVPLDQLFLYKNLTYTQEPSYKLENICQKVLGRGKKEYSGNLMALYEEDIFTFCEYSITDTDLLPALEKEKGHIALQDELRAAASTTHDGASSTIGLADGLFNYDLKTKNMVMRNGSHNAVKRSIAGAYVREPEAGIFEWTIDFDYTSLYPSIICTFNIGPNTFVGHVSQEDAHEYIFFRDKFFANKQKLDIILDPSYNSTSTKISRDQFKKLMDDNHALITPFGTIWKGHDIEKSIFYDIIKKLFNQRKIYKGMMFDAKKAGDKLLTKQYHNKQLSYKILLNSLYGIMANEHFRFYNPDLAETVTICGQHLIKFAGEHADLWMHNNTKGDSKFEVKLNPDYQQDCESTKEYLKYCDTDSLFLHIQPYMEMLGKDCTEDNIADETTKIGNFMNDYLLPLYADMHHVSKEESMLDIKSELMCRRYYTLEGKKKYALHVIREEGIPCDKIDVKGLEIRRSDFSQSTKDMLSELVELILRDNDFNIDKAEEIIDKHRRSILHDVVEGNPAVFKSVSFSKPANQYKVMPQHIKGMKIWNDLEYSHFRHGNRGALVPIKGIDLDIAPKNVVDNYHKMIGTKWQNKDINVIVIPEDVEKVPDYYIINVQAIMQFAVEDRADIMMKPLARKSSICIF